MLSRYGYHMLVIVWLAVLAVIDVVCNTMFTGLLSDVYFYKVFLDGALIWWTILYLKEDLSGQVVTASNARARTATAMPSGRASEDIVHIDLGTSEYIYYGFLFIYGFGNLYFHHSINKEATGFISSATLILSMADLVVAAIAAFNFYQVASGKFVRLQQRLNQ